MWGRLSQFQNTAVHCLKKLAKGSKVIAVSSLFARLCVVDLNQSCEKGKSLLFHGDRENIIAAFMILYNVRVCLIELQCCMQIQQRKPRFHFCQWLQLVIGSFARFSKLFPNDSMQFSDFLVGLVFTFFITSSIGIMRLQVFKGDFIFHGAFVVDPLKEQTLAADLWPRPILFKTSFFSVHHL